MQPKDEIEKAAQVPDHWGYQTSPEDAKRKDWILKTIHMMRKGPFKRALDIGAYEGWLTKDLPAVELFGYEISDVASARFPRTVQRTLKPEGQYDLVIATGVMYAHYDHKSFIKIINEHASGMIVLCNIKTWEVDLKDIQAQEVLSYDFLYNPGSERFVQRVRVFRK